jgi:Dockerin type I domain
MAGARESGGRLTAQRVQRDLDGDGCVNAADLLLLIQAVVRHSEDLVTYDFSNDGGVNALDIAAFARLITHHCR